jgi:hypothetical protein
MATPRPTTYHEASSAYSYTGDARRRHDELTQRDALARARAALRARGELDPARHGAEEHEPLSASECLEILATGEVVARTYRHPVNIDRALEAGASWEQVAALDCDEAQARQNYRKWAQGQHHLWASDYSGSGKLGLNDADYAKAIARVGEPELAAAKAYTASHRVLCAHADQDGRGAHWLEPGESAWRARLSVRRRRGEMADQHDRDWAGAGFTRPGPEADVGYRAGYTHGTAEALAGMTRIFDGSATSFTDGYMNGHRDMRERLAREASAREAEAGR